MIIKGMQRTVSVSALNVKSVIADQTLRSLRGEPVWCPVLVITYFSGEPDVIEFENEAERDLELEIVDNAVDAANNEEKKFWNNN